MKHRKLPLPASFNSKIPGICRWCGKPINKILKNGKMSSATWHIDCVKSYKFYHWPSYTRKMVWNRDKGKCANCGRHCKKKGADGWDMDHIVPLHLANNQQWAWEMANLQTLCKTCHKSKSASEASARATARKQNLDK
jgi:5-methylcytosine-specific restriction endonuclease McrA